MMGRPVPRALLLAFTSALLLALAQAPLSWTPLAFVALLPLEALARMQCTRRTRYLAAFAGGLAFFIGGCHWLAHTAPVNLLLMALSQAPAFPVTVALLRMLRGWPRAVALPLAWVGVESIRATFPFNGFPWLLLGYSFSRPLEFIQAADLGGVWLLSIVLALANGLVVDAMEARRGRVLRLAAVVLLPVALYGYGRWRMPVVLATESAGPTLALIQADIPQELKRANRSPDDILKAYRTLTETALAGRDDVDLVCWPETMQPWPLLRRWRAVPRPPKPTYEWIASEVEAHEVKDDLVRGVLHGRARLLLGTITFTGGTPYQDPTWNSAILYSPAGEREAIYDKTIRVPGGEFIPLRSWMPAALDDFVRSVAGFIPNLVAGDGPRRMELPSRGGRTYAFASTICYENNYPGYGAACAAQGVDFLVNLSNEAWFKDSVEMDQMEVASRFRAVEARRALVRATNSGVSAIYDATGARRAAIVGPGGKDRDVAGTLVERVPVFSARSLFVAGGVRAERVHLVLLLIAGLVAGGRRLRGYRRARGT